MLLRRLKLKGFKSYKNPTTIDFTKMPIHDLFLIQGNTGSGKSSILDAITFVFYGSLKNESISYITNSIKEEVEKNPDSYKGKTITEVELEFEFYSSIYQVSRIIKIKNFRQIPKTLSDLYEISFYCYRDNKECQERLDFLEKLTVEQFTQSMIIPQNQFDQFLRSKPLEKEEILKKIFNSEKYDKFINFLNDKKKSFSEKLEKIKIQSEAILKKSDIHKSLEDPNIFFYFKNKILENLEVIKEKKESINLKIKNKENLYNFKKVEENKKELIEKLLSLLIEQNEFKKKKQQIEEKKIQLEASQKVIDLYPLWEVVINLKQKIQETKEEQKKIQNLLENKQKEFEKIKILQQELEKKTKSIDRKKIELNEKKELLPKFVIFKKAQNQLVNLKESKNHTERLLEENRHKLENLNSQLEEIYRSYFSKQLKPNEACPICGSTVHPQPFLSSTILEPEKILEQKKQIEKTIKNLEKELERFQREIQKEEESIQSLKDYLEKKEYDLRNIDLLETIFKKDIVALQSEINEFETTVKQTNFKLQEVSETIGKLLGSKENIEKSLWDLQKEFEEKEKQLQELLKREKLQEEEIKKYYLKKEVRDKLENEIKEFSYQEIQIETKIQEIQKDLVHDLDFLFVSEKEKLNNLLRKKEEIDRKITEIQDQLSKIEEQIQQDSQTIGKLENENKNLNQALQELEELLKKYQECSKEFHLINTIWTIVSDENPKKISFHRYILQAYFELVIQNANERLKKIEPRFILKSTEERDDTRKKKAGLGIKIFDMYHGERSIDGLSGGETFYVSIALALGLYDIIHTTFSNIKFDFLFIDEGFGSLDQEKLSSVLSTLKDIFIRRGVESQKQVGLISHVESMKDQIPYQIIIQNQNGISSVEYKVL
ncbi:MAG: AAA family ATPase [Leptonema sp. (in: bacteria)]